MSKSHDAIFDLIYRYLIWHCGAPDTSEDMIGFEYHMMLDHYSAIPYIFKSTIDGKTWAVYKNEDGKLSVECEDDSHSDKIKIINETINLLILPHMKNNLTVRKVTRTILRKLKSR